MKPEERKALNDLREQATAGKGRQHTATVAGWHFILEHANDEYEHQGMPGTHLSARLDPPSRSSADKDWAFLGQAVDVLGVPDHEALLTPLATTPPNAVHHWHWNAPREFVERMREFLKSPGFKTAAQEIHGQPPKIGRNEPCVCGSGKKYKHCCLGKVVPAVPASTSPFGACEGPGTQGMLGGERCGRPGCGVDECKLCGKRYVRCHAHHEAIRTMLHGHVLRVHPETLPKSKFLEILKNPVMMNGLRQQHERSPELWQRFFEYAAEVQRGLS